jgi:UDP-glucose 4-epimerase
MKIVVIGGTGLIGSKTVVPSPIYARRNDTY